MIFYVPNYNVICCFVEQKPVTKENSLHLNSLKKMTSPNVTSKEKCDNNMYSIRKNKKANVKIKMMQNMSKVIRTFVFKLKCLGGGNCLLDFKQPKESSISVNICSKE